jgi:hypothetical protein
VFLSRNQGTEASSGILSLPMATRLHMDTVNRCAVLLAVLCALACWGRLQLCSASMIGPSVSTNSLISISSSNSNINSSSSSNISININSNNSSNIHIDSTSAPGSGLFYMYDLEEKYWWRYPDPSVNCNKSNGYLPSDAHRNSGMGESIDMDKGLFSSWHGSIFNALFNRLKRSVRRTRDPEQASFFVVPYDLGLDGFVSKNDCSTPRWPGCTRDLAFGVIKMLTKSVHYNRYKGADHVLLWSLGEMHPWPGNGCKVLMETFCKNCTLTCYWSHPRMKGYHFVSLPFSSSFHYHDALKVLPWTAGPPSDRPIFAAYAGSTQTLNPDHTKIRRSAVAQCSEYKACEHLVLQHTSTDKNVVAASSLYKKSIFCLCPPGDDPTRKALVDMLLMGCIPVLMHMHSLHDQLPYHMNESLAIAISVYIPGK